MSEVKRYLADEQYPGQYSARCDLVPASAYDAAQSQLAALRNELGECKGEYDRAVNNVAALREELATSKRNEHNSEVAYKAAIEKQEELRGERNELSLQASRLKVDNENYDRLLVRKSNQCDAVQQRLADAERRNAGEPDIEAAALKLAACMDYPWEFMPEQGRASMHEHAKAVIDAALNPKPEAASHD